MNTYLLSATLSILEMVKGAPWLTMDTFLYLFNFSYIGSKHFADEPLDYLLELLGREDTYPSESFVLYAGGHSCVVESEHLYKALQSLPEKQRKVLLLDFWCDRTDREIAKEMEVTTRTVYNLRQRAYKAIRTFYERERLYPWTEL